jgi:hypothetical protein
MKKIVKEESTKFYLYNPIPIVKQEASEVIQRILRTHDVSFEYRDAKRHLGCDQPERFDFDQK